MAAAQHGADTLLLVAGSADVDAYNNPLSVLYITPLTYRRPRLHPCPMARAGAEGRRRAGDLDELVPWSWCRRGRMTAQRFNVELREYAEGWRANFYSTGMAHSSSLDQHGSRRRGRAVQRDAWEAL